LESTTLESIKDEIKMGEDGWIAPNEKVEKGHWNGADYMFVGKITRFASKQKSYGGGGWSPLRLPGLPRGGNFDVSTSQADVQIDWRISDTATRAVVKTGRAEGRETGTGWGFGTGLGSGFVRDQEFLESALGKATLKAIDQIVAELKQLNLGPGTRALQHVARQEKAAANQKAAVDALRAAPGVVEAVTPQFLVVSLGEKQNLKPGDKLDLYQVSEVRNKKGEVVLRDEKRVGEGTVQTVAGDKCKVSFSPGLTPEEGWIARVPGAGLAASGTL
jgi:hypothetical protein